MDTTPVTEGIACPGSPDNTTMEGCPLELMNGRYERTGRAWEALNRGERKVIPAVMQIRDADLITMWSPIGIYVSVWVREAGPLRLTGQIFHNIEGKRRDAVINAIPGEEDGVSFHLDEYGTLWAETDAQDETALPGALERLTGQIRAHLDPFSRAVDGLEEDGFNCVPLIRDLLEETGDQFNFEHCEDGWSFTLYHRELDKSQMNLMLTPEGMTIMMCMEDQVPADQRMEMLAWINRMNHGYRFLNLSMDEEGYLWIGLDFLLIPQEELVRETLTIYMNIACQVYGFCREELDRREETAGEGN